MTDTTLLTSIVEVDRSESSTPGVRMFSISGEPYASAIVGVVAANYERLTGRSRPDGVLVPGGGGRVSSPAGRWAPRTPDRQGPGDRTARQ